MKKKCTSQFFLNSLRFSYNLFRIKKQKLLLNISLIVTICMIMNVQLLTAQSSGTKVSFESKNLSLDQTLKALDKQTSMRISYTVDLVSPYNHISIEKGERSIENTLNLILANTNLTYEIKGDNILIIKKQEKNSKQSEKSLVTASGKVTDKEGIPLAGVTVISQNSKAATITDNNGAYSIHVPKDDIVAFSFIGLEKKLIKISDTQTLNVTLSENINTLDEVQVIGYGTTTRRFKTSGVASIKAEQIQSQPTSSNFLQTLQGKLSGVSISQSGGGVGNSPEIYIRGVNSISSGNSPLYIVDGVIINGSSLDNASVGGLNGNVSTHNALGSINQADIVSIDVLKDADATAIYGSRGANGVVLITTKRAELGKTTFTLDANTGFNSTITTKYLNLEQYLALRKEAFAVNGITPTAANAPDLLTWSQTDGEDWGKKLNNGSGAVYNVNGTLTGGSRHLSYLASLGYSKLNDTYFSNPYKETYSGKLNVNHTSENDRLTASFNFSFSNEDYKPGYGSKGSNSTFVYSLPPNFPVYNSDGSYYWGKGTSWSFVNPYAKETSSVTSKTVDYLTSGEIAYKIWKGLTAKLAASHNYQNNDNQFKLYNSSISTVSPGTEKVGVTQALTTFTSFNIEPQLTYKTQIGKGTLDALVGSTWFTKQTEYKKVEMTGFASETFFDAWGAAGTTTPTSYYTKYNMRSWFGRLNYNWDNRYIANATYRTDGSSRFGTENRWGQFGALGAGWLYGNESFVKKALPWLSFGKLRASYGITGNDNITDWRYLSLFATSANYYTPYNYSGSTALLSTYLPNTDIKWEKTRKIEVALENAFFNDRISTSVAYFNNRTTDMLMDVTVAGTTGFASQTQNFGGVVDNKGWEVEINSTNLKTKNFTWRTGFNITFQKNELVKMPPGTAGTLSKYYFKGKPIVRYYGYNFSRIDPATGNALWINATTGAEQTTVDATSTYLGSRLPTIFGGLNNSLQYKGFTLDFSISFAKQTMTDALYYFQGSNVPGTATNMPAIVLGKYWQKAGDEAIYPKLDAMGTNTTNSNVFTTSSTVFHDGFYFKFQNIALSYDLPTEWLSKIGSKGLNLYLRGQNLFYVTPGNNLGKDPERVMSGGLTLNRSFVAGLKVKF